MTERPRLLPGLAEPHRGRIACALWIGLAATLVVLGKQWFSSNHERVGDRNFHHFLEAGRALVEGRDPYRSAGGGYVYPPLLAVVFMPLVSIPWIWAGRIWVAGQMAAMFLSGRAAARDARRRFGLAPDSLSTAIACWIGCLVLSRAIRHQMHEGQADFILAGSLIVSLACLERRPIVSGLLLGLAANVKYHTLALVPYLLVRRRWRAAASALGSTIAFALLPALVVGWEKNLGYLRQALAGLAGLRGNTNAQAGVPVQGEAPAFTNLYDVFWDSSLSVTSAIARALRDAGHVDHEGKGTATLAACVAAAGAIMLGLGLALYRFARVRSPFTRPADDPTDARLTAVEWWGVVVGTLALSPQTHHRHLLLVLGLAVLAGSRVLARTPGRAWLALGLGAFLLSTGRFKFLGEGAQWAWHGVAGPMLALLAMYYVLVWATLRGAREVRS